MYKWYAKVSKKRARQMVYRQSDGRVVPMKSGSPRRYNRWREVENVGNPLSTAMRNKLKGETLATLRR